MITNNHSEITSNRDQVWRDIMQRLNSRQYFQEYDANWHLDTETATNMPRMLSTQEDLTRTRGYNYNWVAFDDSETADLDGFIGRPNNEVTRRQILERLNSEVEATVNHTRLTDAEMRFRGTEVNIRALPQEVIDIIVMPQRDMARKERLYLKVIQDLNEQLQNIKTVTKCTVERVEL